MNTKPVEAVSFWIVWNPQGYFAPKFKHPSYELAEKEATRLATENPGQKFYVLAPICEVIFSNIHITRFVGTDIPF